MGFKPWLRWGSLPRGGDRGMRPARKHAAPRHDIRSNRRAAETRRRFAPRPTPVFPRPNPSGAPTTPSFTAVAAGRLLCRRRAARPSTCRRRPTPRSRRAAAIRACRRTRRIRVCRRNTTYQGLPQNSGLQGMQTGTPYQGFCPQTGSAQPFPTAKRLPRSDDAAPRPGAAGVG